MPSLAEDLDTLYIPTTSREALSTQQEQYVRKRLSQGVCLDTFDEVSEWLFLPFLGVGIVALTVILTQLEIEPVPNFILYATAGVFYLVALLFVAFGIFDLAFPVKGAVRTFWLFTFLTLIAVGSIQYTARTGHEQTVWVAAVSGLIAALLFAVLRWIRFKYFNVKHISLSGSSGWNEENAAPSAMIQEQINRIQTNFPETRVDLYRTSSWIGNTGLPIKITRECNLYFYQVYRPNGRGYEVVCLPQFWEA